MQKTYSTAQFKHTELWNSIIDHLKSNIHSRRHRSGIKYFDNCFNGAEFVDNLYEYLASKQSQFENEVTKEKVAKLSQSIMESGLFEPISSTQTKFDNSSTRLYRFKLSSADKENYLAQLKDAKCDSNDIKKPSNLNKKLRKMLENLREKPDSIENADKHNTSMQRITREVILEKLLMLIDLPIIEYFLETDHNENYKKELDIKSNDPSLTILHQIFDLSRCELNEEWRQSALDCIEFIKFEKKLKETSDMDLYVHIREYYSKKCFFSDIYTPLFTQILILLKHSNYTTALETLNLGTLLLSLNVQAELKRLLKFLYLTSNNTSSPKLNDKKPNHSIVLNNFAECLFKLKLFTFEESRLLLNFMFNNFDHLFLLSKTMKDQIVKRCALRLKYGEGETLLEKQYCKRVSMREFESIGKEQTTQSLVQLANSLIDDATISLKDKKAKLKLLQEVHPEIYSQYFANML